MRKGEGVQPVVPTNPIEPRQTANDQGSVAEGWQDIATAPRDGMHILVADFTSGSTGFGHCGPILPGTTWRSVQPFADVAHWFDDPDDPGFYASSYGGDQEKPFMRLTHWRPLPEPPPKEPGE